jgi:predicted PurR-regulated permease PerM
MLYLLFFLLRDGEDLVKRVINVTPLRPAQRAALFKKFTLVVRATVKGQILVAILQGMLGGFAFWILGIHSPILWAVLMAALSLLPAIGAALVWFPVAIYLLVIGAIWQGVLLMAFGIVIISLVDNILRPLMIGQATEIPDYVVLISALGGIATFGIHGFIIGPVVAAMFIGIWDIYTSEAHPIVP